MSYSKCRGGMGDPVTSPSDVDPSLIQLNWLNLDGSALTAATSPSGSAATPASSTSTSAQPITTDSGISPVLLLGGAAVVAYFLFKKGK